MAITRAALWSTFCFFLGALFLSSLASDEPAESPPLTLRLSVQRTTFKVGEEIPMRVEIANQGPGDVFVGRTLVTNVGWIHSLQIQVFNEQGDASPRLVAGMPYVFPASETENFWDHLVKKWIALPPGYWIGTEVPIDGETHKLLNKPGRYRIAAVYMSRGMEASEHYNRLAMEPSKLRGLPFPSWKGTSVSNDLWIEVVP